MSKKSIITASAGIIAFALTFGLTAQEKTKNWKDQAEYDLFTLISKADTTDANRLATLDKWKQQYPQSEYADTRERIRIVPL